MWSVGTDEAVVVVEDRIDVVRVLDRVVVDITGEDELLEIEEVFLYNSSLLPAPQY